MKIKHLHQIIMCIMTCTICNGLVAQTFSKITIGPHVNDGEESEACAWGDFDNDGDEDLFVANGLITNKANYLFVNEGPGNDYSFRLFEEGDIVNDASCSRASSWGDYDNDGDLDLYVTNQILSNYNFLYLNNGDSTFTRYTQGSVACNNVESEVAEWVDYNNDGYLDLFSANYNEPNGLYHNNGDGCFTSDLENAIAIEGIYQHAWCDFDNDGDLDLHADIYATGETAIFINEGNGSFTKIQQGMVLNDPTDPISGDNWVDYDNDGDWDFVSIGNKIYRNEGPDFGYRFTKITHPDSIITTWGFPQWADMDNDGDIDCFVEYVWDRNNLWSNNGDGTFTKSTEGDIVEDSLPTTGSAWADYDNDGDMDLYVCNSQFYGSNETYNNNLFRNDNNNGNGWIKIKLKGTASNAIAIGSVIKVKASTSGTDPIWQMRAVEGQSGFLGQNSLIAHFGLGTAAIIDSLVVVWPAGHETVFTDVEINQLKTITEDLPENYLRAEFTASTTIGLDELEVQFTDNSLFDPDNPITSWSWDFNGDGSPDSEEQNPAYTFSNADGLIFDISLVISNGTETDTLIRTGLINMIPSEGNLAFLGTASASSEVDALACAEKAIDGESGICSIWTAERNDEEWFQVDLRASYNIGKVVIQWGRGYGAEYKLQTSTDGVNWNDVYCECDGDGEEDIILFTGIDAQFVKWQGYDRGSTSPYSMNEFEVFVSDGNEYQLDVECCESFVGIKNNSFNDQVVRIYPNPVVKTAQISYELHVEGKVGLDIYNCLGMKIQNLINEIQYPGEYKIEWDAEGIKPGIYFCIFEVDGFVQIQKLIVSH